MNKRLALTAAAGVVLIGSIAGCNTRNQAPDDVMSANPKSGKPPATKFSIAYMTTTNTGYFSRIPDLSKDKWITKLGEKTNTELKVRVIEESKMPIMFAGNDIPDVVGSNGTPTSKTMSGSVEAGMFLPLDDALKQYAPKLLSMIPKEAWDAVSYNGKIYAIPTYLSNKSRRATFIRTDLLQKAGLQPPRTIEEMLEVLRAFKRMGIEHPYQMRENLKYADLILGAYDVLPYRDQFEVVNGQVVPKFFDVENIEKALQVYKTMVEEGLIAKDFATISSTDYYKFIRSGKAGMWSSNATALVDFRTSIQQVEPKATVDIIASPTGPESKGGYFYYTPVVNAFYINKNVKPDAIPGILHFFDWMATEDAEKFFTFGIEGDNYTVENGKINYKIPQTKEEIEEEGWRSGMLWGAHDGTATRMRLELDQNGRDTLKALDTVLLKEGLPGIGFNPDLTAFAKYPDIAPQGQDGIPKLILDHMIKMIYGKEPISEWPAVIEEYKAKGGKELLEEANERYWKKEGIVNFYQD
ncbi:extracellular solute-binding protein [Paenibacillus cremeus]|uniref:Extracellular solute-binding protein n=1 Tax=Paenibacillus cremeus TaxID=2163881 RepID=A0A559K480_9BACL|nr:extracellular solute-binding protein [Paenibacillus cremeus]TVY06934.1 extracellular solute-binding protein [Paenibacillus cremeus]